MKMDGKGIGHPLMPADKAVVNDICIGEPSRLHLITGSNMSGKSTYLRTIGLNILLAQIGAPVSAKTFHFTPLRLLTSFHHIDSLEEGSSYFHAELKGLQNIIQQLDGPVPALVLLDEVMRGTNSADKHEGTAMLIRKLLGHHCLTLIATHDTELGLLEQQYVGRIENYCFESELTPQGLHFDFLRKQGVAQTKNATYLMQQMGIV
jgi:DNA mismatch repair ATPase MutS